MKLAGTLAAITVICAAAAHADELKRGDFAYSMELSTKPGIAVHRLSVPLDVYRHTVRRDLADIRVFNATGEVVPYALQRSPAETKYARAPARLPLFKLHGDPARATQALRLSVSADGTNIELQGERKQSTELPVSGYLLDARSLESPLAALTLEWPEPEKGFSTHVAIETSDDLAYWRLVVAAAALVDLRHESDRLQQRRVEFAPTRGKFWRVRWSVVPGPAPLTGVLAEQTSNIVEATRQELVVPGVFNSAPADAREVANGPGEFSFDLGAHPPVDRINLVLPQVNTVADVEFIVADGDKQWRSVWLGSVYRLATPGGEISNAFVDVLPLAAEHWGVRLRGESGIGSATPKLAVRWLPHELTFLARGEGPYEIAYGNFTAPAAAITLDRILSLSGYTKVLPVSAAQAGPEREVGGPSRLQPPPPSLPWRAIALWAILVVAVGMLGAMAWKLARQLQRSSSGAAQ